MRALLEIYRVQLRTWLVIQMQYRASMAIWMIGRVVQPVIYLVVWSTVAQSRGGDVGGFTTADFAAYFIVLMLVNQATFTWVMWEYDYLIRQGALSFMLLRPLHPIHKDIAENISYKILTMVVILPTVAALTLIFRPALPWVPWAVRAFVPALLLAFALRFLFEWTLALAAFWTTRVSALNQMYFVAMLFFSGQIAPLELFPAPVQAVAALLPFRWMVAFPVELALGRLAPADALRGLATQAVWLLLTWGLMTVVWRAGVRRYSAVGS
jgi:ABC-2 type transport system permease protein